MQINDIVAEGADLLRRIESLAASVPTVVGDYLLLRWTDENDQEEYSSESDIGFDLGMTELSLLANIPYIADFAKKYFTGPIGEFLIGTFTDLGLGESIPSRIYARYNTRHDILTIITEKLSENGSATNTYRKVVKDFEAYKHISFEESDAYGTPRDERATLFMFLELVREKARLEKDIAYFLGSCNSLFLNVLPDEILDVATKLLEAVRKSRAFGSSVESDFEYTIKATTRTCTEGGDAE